MKPRKNSLKNQISQFLNLWEKAGKLNGFSLRIRTFDTIREELIELVKKLINTVQINGNLRKFGLNFTSKCHDNLLWTAPEFVFKTFLKSNFGENRDDFQCFLFNFEHIFSKKIDKGIILEDFDQIFKDFISKYPGIELVSLHVKVFSWMNIDDTAFTIISKLLAIYGENIADLQLLFSGYLSYFIVFSFNFIVFYRILSYFHLISSYFTIFRSKITDKGLKALNSEIIRTVGENRKMTIFSLGFDSRTSLITDLGFVDICETILKISGKNPINTIRILLTSKEISNKSMNVLSFTMARIYDKIRHFTIFIAGQ